jgi:AcrR family transcriptional regulator
MDAALELFLQHGVAATTIEQITVGAGVAKGTFYLHFSSKEEVLDALRERFIQNVLAGINAEVSRRPSDDWQGRLEAWAHAAVGGYLDALRLHDVVFHESPPQSHSREEHSDNELVAHLTSLLEAGAGAGAWRVEDTRSTAVFMFHGFHGVVDESLAKEKRINRPRLVRKIAMLFCGVLGLSHAAGA